MNRIYFYFTSLVFLVSPLATYASFYYGPRPQESAESGKYVVLKGENSDWHARSVMAQDLEKIDSLIRDYGLSEDPALRDAVVYLYTDAENDLFSLSSSFKRHQARIRPIDGMQTRPSPYQWLWFESKKRLPKGSSTAEGLIFVERMPRAVMFPDTQKEILDLYRKMGTMTLNEDLESLNFLGKYRPIQDQAILEIRILPQRTQHPAQATLDTKTVSDILSTLSRFFRTVSQDHVAPYYPTDSAEDRPAFTFSYTYSPIQEEASGSSQHSYETSQIFNEYFPDKHRDPQQRRVFYRRFTENTEALQFDPSLAELLKVPSSQEIQSEIIP